MDILIACRGALPATHLAAGISPIIHQVSCDQTDDCVRKLQLFMENGGSVFHL